MSKHGSGGGKGSAGGKSGAGKGSGGTPMTKADASCIQSAGDRDASSSTAKSGFGSRAQIAGDRNANEKG